MQHPHSPVRRPALSGHPRVLRGASNSGAGSLARWRRRQHPAPHPRQSRHPPRPGKGASTHSRRALRSFGVGIRESQGAPSQPRGYLWPSPTGCPPFPALTGLQGRRVTAAALSQPRGTGSSPGTRPGCGASVGGGVPGARDVFPGSSSSSSSSSGAGACFSGWHERSTRGKRGLERSLPAPVSP